MKGFEDKRWEEVMKCRHNEGTKVIRWPVKGFSLKARERGTRILSTKTQERR